LVCVDSKICKVQWEILNKNPIFSHRYRGNILLVLQESDYMIRSTIQGGVLQIHSRFTGSNYKYKWVQSASWLEYNISNTSSRSSIRNRLNEVFKHMSKMRWSSTWRYSQETRRSSGTTVAAAIHPKRRHDIYKKIGLESNLINQQNFLLKTNHLCAVCAALLPSPRVAAPVKWTKLPNQTVLRMVSYLLREHI
jgi:hypothetical protein